MNKVCVIRVFLLWEMSLTNRQPSWCQSVPGDGVSNVNTWLRLIKILPAMEEVCQYTYQFSATAVIVFNVNT